MRSDLVGNYTEGRHLLRTLGPLAMQAARQIISDKHPRLKVADAHRVFAFHPSLIGENLDALVVVAAQRKFYIALSFVGFEFAPQMVVGAETSERFLKNDALDLLALAYVIVLENRDKPKVRKMTGFRVRPDYVLQIAEDEIHAYAQQWGWKPSAQPGVMMALKKLIGSMGKKIQFTNGKPIENADFEDLKENVARALFLKIGHKADF